MACEVMPIPALTAPVPPQVHRSRRQRQAAAILASIVTYSSRSVQLHAACPPAITHHATRLLGACSSPRCSDASATLWPALERLLVSPCPPTNILSRAGRLGEVFAALQARLRPAGLLETASPTLRRARLALGRLRGRAWRRARRVAANERAVGGVWRRVWRLSIPTARCACDGVRCVEIGQRRGARGLAARVRT